LGTDLKLKGFDLLWWPGVHRARELLAPVRGDSILMVCFGLGADDGGVMVGYGCVGIMWRGGCLKMALVRLFVV
jgi:hypothetical protein